MASSKIRLAVITTSKTNADSALASFAKIHCFVPVEAIRFVDVVHGLSALPDDNPCPMLLSNIADLEKKYSLFLTPSNIDQPNENITHLQKEIEEAKIKLADFTKASTDLLKELAKYEEAIKQVKTLIGLNVPLEDIFSCNYVYARFGRLPNDSVEKLDFYQDKPFIFKSFAEDNNYSWCMYFTSMEFEREVDNIFSSLFFERFFIPEFVHGTPKQAVKTLSEKKEKIAAESEIAKTNLSNAVLTASGSLSKIKGELLLINRINTAKKYVVVMGEKISISGFVRSKDVSKISASLKDNPKLELEIMPADADARFIPPKKIKVEDFY